MPATIDQARDEVRRELRTYRRRLHVAAKTHHFPAIRRALHDLEALEALEALEEDLTASPPCECEVPDCPGPYKPDGSHELAF